jgi:hypothetical protein
MSLPQSAAEWAWLRQHLADLPTPRAYADAIPHEIAESLLVCLPTGGAAGHVPTEAIAASLRPFGLCDYPSKISTGRFLTNFGIAVAREIISDWKIK